MVADECPDPVQTGIPPPLRRRPEQAGAGARTLSGGGGEAAGTERTVIQPHPFDLGGPQVSYAELWRRAARVAGGLRDVGVGPGDRVAIRLGNGLDWVLAFWGTHLAGGIAVPVNTRLAEPEVEFIVGGCDARYVVRPGEPLPDGEPGEPADLPPQAVAALFYTSGTTGRPKGAMNTHENLVSTIESTMRCVRLDRTGRERSVALISVPLFHVTGCNSQMLTQLAIGGTVVVLRQLDLPALLAAVPAHGVTMMTTVPTIWELTLRHADFPGTDVSSVRIANYGGAPIAPELVHRLRAAFPQARLGNGFGTWPPWPTGWSRSSTAPRT